MDNRNTNDNVQYSFYYISNIYRKNLKENKIQEKEFENIANIVEEDMNVRETSTKGVEKSSWYLDYSYFLEGGSSFFARGGLYWYGVGAEIFSFHRTVWGQPLRFGVQASLGVKNQNFEEVKYFEKIKTQTLK